MATLIKARDAAYPQNLSGYTGTIVGYYGGPRAYNVWSAPQWATFKKNDKIPVWVGGLSGSAEAPDAISTLQALGVPKGCITILDMETRIDKTYVTRFYMKMNHAGYLVWVYGSSSTLFYNPPCNGYAVADPTGAEHLYPHPGVRMTQYAFGPYYDNDVVRQWLYSQHKVWV